MRLFGGGRKKKEKGDGSGGRESVDPSDSDTIQIPTKVQHRYSMVPSSSTSSKLTDSVDDKGKAVDTPDFFINTLKVLPKMEVLVSLCSTLQSKGATWAKTFMELSGIEVLLNVLATIDKNENKKADDVVLQSLTMTCLISLMNTKLGLETAIKTVNSMQKLILCLDTPRVDTRSSVIELLTAVCLVSDEGFRTVLDAFTHFKNIRKEKVRFTFLLDTMKKTDTADFSDIDYLTVCLGLINGLVNSSEEVDERVQLRTEFTRLGLDEFLSKNKSIPYEDAPDLLTQIDVYEDEARADQEEMFDRINGLDINIENPKEVFEYILAQVEKRPHHPLLNILQCLLAIPSNTDSGMLQWFLIEKLIQQVSVSKQMIGDDGITDKISLEDLLASTGPSVAMQAELQKVTEELIKVKDQLKKVTFDLNIAHTELSSREQETSMMKSNLFNTVKMKNQELSKLKGQMKKIDHGFFSPPDSPTLESSTGEHDVGAHHDDSSDSVPSPNSTTSGKPPKSSSSNPKSGDEQTPPLKSALKKSTSTTASSTDLSTSAASSSRPQITQDTFSNNTSDNNNNTQPTESAPPAPPVASPPPPPPSGGPPPPPPPGPPPPPPPPGGGPPPPPPPPGGGPPPPPGPPGGPPPPPGGLKLGGGAAAPKFNIAKPSTKTKQLQWTKIPQRKLGETIFSKLGNVKTDWINIEQLETLFVAAEAAKKTDEKKKDTTVKPGSLSVIDQKKSQNLAIYLSKFKCTIPEIKTALYTLDEEILNHETLKSLESYLPKEEDMEALKDYLKAGDAKMLAKPDQFIMEMDTVPNVLERVRSFYLKITFPDKLREIKPDLDLFVSAIKQLQSSKSFLKVIEIILVIGNFLNGGTARGDCFGFKLDGLLKLTDTKTTNNKSNLLVYIISELESKFPQVLQFTQELPDVQPAGKISLQTISADLNKLKKDLEIVDDGISKMKRTREDTYFFQTLDEFIKDAKIEIKIVFEQFTKAESEFAKLAVLFGEEPKMASEDFFSMINKFISTFERAHRDYLREKESAERAAKREALKAKKAQMTKKLTTGRASILPRGSKSEIQQDPNSGVDDILQTVRDGDAFKQRRQKKVNPNGSQRGDKGDDDKVMNGNDSQRGERNENGAKKKDVQVAAKALTIVMRSRQNYSRIDQFSFGNDEK